MVRPIPPGRSDRRGMVMAALLLLLLSLALLGHGALLLAEREFQSVRAFQHAVRAGFAAEGAAARVAGSTGLRVDPRVRDSIVRFPMGWSDEGLWREGSLRWLGPEMFLVEGVGMSRGWPGARRVGAVGWAMDPAARIADFGAAVELGGRMTRSPGAAVVAPDPLQLPLGWDSLVCDPFRKALDSIFSGSMRPLAAPLPPLGSTPSGGGSSIPQLGLFTGDELLARGGSPALTGALGLGPSSGCPPSGESVYWSTDSDLILRDSHVCGLLVVEGDLHLRGMSLVQGLILVGGKVILTGSSRLDGMARVGESLQLEDSAILHWSGCSALRALSQAGPLLEPLVLSGASRIPLF